MNRFGYWVLAVALVGTAIVAPSATAETTPAWIWSSKSQDNQRIWLRQSFTIAEPVKSARLTATCDNSFTLFFNGKRILTGSSWGRLETADVSRSVSQGKNVVAVEAFNDGGPAGFVAKIQVVTQSGKTIEIVTDDQWKVTEQTGRFNGPNLNDSGWSQAKVIGSVGDNLPWSKSITVDNIAASLKDMSSAEYMPKLAENTKALDGFIVETVFEVPPGMGSWVALATDDKGRLIASDQQDAGMFLITPGNDSQPTKVEKLPVKLSSAQGLLWAFDSLYVMVNGPDPGLYRVKDTDGDGLVDSHEYLMHVPGGGEHGPHAVILAPDGKSLFVCSGNHTDLPSEISANRLAAKWDEDLLLPRRWDANGHAAGRLAPGGWVCKVDPDGKNWEVVSIGYRNNYDIAFNADGELFGYDADMEWDLGSPWYRPTRVCHATSGSEFGWRSGTGKWPEYYEDSLPGVLDIGPGSPTGILFGYGTKFPAKYQKALYLLDWTYSTIYAVHLTPHGSSYTATKEDFVTGTPLSVTDATVGGDGHLYFAVGGRGTQSLLYRVRYQGNESVQPVDARDSRGEELRTLRHRLEAMHQPGNSDIKFILENLGHSDRFIRYAARIALEHVPAESWKQELGKLDPLAAINGVIALARCGQPSDLELALNTLGQIEYASLSQHDGLALLRAYALAFIRLGAPNDQWKQRLIERFDAVYPSKTYQENAELVQLLVYLEAPSVVEKTLALMDSLGKDSVPDWGELAARNAHYGGTVKAMMDNMPPVRGIHFAFVLRNVKQGWTLDQRRKYFSFFIEAAKHPGGASYPGFLTQMREDALLTCSPAEKVALDAITSKSLTSTVEVVPPKGPGRAWTKEEALALLEKGLKRRNYDRGRNLFHAVSCAKCHRYNGEGGAIGPDLSTAGQKFSLSDLLDSVLEPSKVISDQYGSHQVLTADGEVIVGRVVEIDGNVHIYTAEADAPPRVIPKSEIEEMTVSKVSQMPKDLINPLNEEELLDLIAYLKSGGNRRAAVYR